MKSQYLYFGRKLYYSQAGVAPTSQLAALTALTIANAGGVPANLSYGGGDALNVQVVYRVYDAGSSKRGSSYTAANGHIGVNFPDMFQGQTGDGLDTTDATSPYGTPANHVLGETTLLLDEAYQVSSGVVTIKEATASGSGSATAGATLTTNDTVWVNETALVASGATPLYTIVQDIFVPARAFLGGVPMAADVGNGLAGGHSTHDGGMHWNGDDIDVVDLHFASGDSRKAADVIQLKYTGGKYKELMEVMQSFMNGNNYEEMITVHELDYNGQNVHPAFAAKGIKIYGCTIVSTARS